MEKSESFTISVLFFFKDDPLHKWVHTVGVFDIPSKEHIKDMKNEVAELLAKDGFGDSNSDDLDFCLVPKESMDVFYDLMNKSLAELEKLGKEEDETQKTDID
jgi:hypothetical protein